MNSKSVAVLLSLACAASLVAGPSAWAMTANYPVAHVKHQNSSLVVVEVNASFFRGSVAEQGRWFTAVEQCVRSVKMAGQTLLVAKVNGSYRFYAPKHWHSFMQTIDLNWVNARVNKSLTCNY